MDSQQKKLYAWENTQAWMDKSAVKQSRYDMYIRINSKRAATGSELARMPTLAMNRHQCESFIERAIHYVKPDQKCPPLQFTGSARRAHGAHWIIQLPIWGRTKAVILHECAHALQPSGTEWHGAEFTGIFIALVHKFLGQPVAALRDSALKAGLKVGPIPFADNNTHYPIPVPEPGPWLSGLQEPSSKRCSRCHGVRPIGQFARDRSSKDGHYSQCKSCERDARNHRGY